MRTTTTTSALLVAAVLFASACKSQDNVPRTAPVDPGREVPPTPPDEPIGAALHHLTVIPSAAQLALGINTDQPSTAALKSDVRSVALGHFAAVSGAIGLVHERIEDLEKASPTTLASDPDCLSWKAHDAHHDWELISCLRDKVLRHYEIRLEARPRDTSDQVAVIVAGEVGLDLVDAHPETTPERKFRQRLQRAGRIGYDFDRLREVVGTGPVGSITIGYRVDDSARAINVELVGFAPMIEAMPLSGNQSFEDAVASGGRTELVVISDFVKDAENGSLQRGQDGRLERTGLALAWDAKGLVRANAETCTIQRAGELERCSHLHQCWAPSGAPRFESYSKSGEDLGWIDSECPRERFPLQTPPDPRSADTRNDRELPSARVLVPSLTVLSLR